MSALKSLSSYHTDNVKALQGDALKNYKQLTTVITNAYKKGISFVKIEQWMKNQKIS